MGLTSSEVEQRHRWYQHLLLMCLLVLLCFTLPQRWRVVNHVGYDLLPLMLVAGLGRLSSSEGFRRPGWLFRFLGLCTTASGVLWAVAPVGLRSTGMLLLVLWGVFVGWSLLRLLRLLAREQRVTWRVLSGAMAGYLLLGLTAGLIFAALETVLPSSFVDASGSTRSVLMPQGTLTPQLWDAVWSLDFVRINYYAFITLTSTGFGDILPHNPQAQMATIVVSILGIFYVAVVMGILISRLTVQDSLEEQDSVEGKEAELLGRLEKLLERLERNQV